MGVGGRVPPLPDLPTCQRLRNSPLTHVLSLNRPPIHLEIQRHHKNPVGILRTTFRDPADGKVKHQQHGRLTGLPLSTLLNVQAVSATQATRRGVGASSQFTSGWISWQRFMARIQGPDCEPVIRNR